MSPRLTPTRALLATAAALLLGVQVLSSPTLSGWTSGQVMNSINETKTGTGAYAFTHTYTNPTSRTCGASGSTANASCADSILPRTVPATGTSTQNDSIYNSGSQSGVSNFLSVPSCGPVKLSNQRASDGNPMLPRAGGWTYGVTGPRTGMGAVTLDGTTGYATSLRTRTWTQPTTTNGGAYALGIWFRTTASTTREDPLIALGSTVVGNTNGSERLGLTVDSGGRLRGLIASDGSFTQSPNPIRDGNWHFGYLSVTAASAQLWVDGTLVDQTASPTLDATSASAFYWRLGTASSIFSTTRFLTGSIAGAVAYQGPTSTMPAAPTATQLASQTAFDAWATPYTEYWKLSDSGTTIHTGTKPDWLNTTACNQVNLSWSATTPTGSSAARTLAAWSTAASIPAPGPALLQSSTLSLSRITGFDSDAVGLWLLPTVQMSHGVSGTWLQTFTWSTTPATSRILVQ